MTATQFENRADWLAARGTGIGASEAASVLGLSPFETPLSIYLRKVGAVDPIEENESMYWGSAMEPLLAKRYTEVTGLEVSRSQLFARHPEYPHIFATYDGFDENDDLIEFKCIGQMASRDKLGDDDTDQIPEHWLVQAHQQMAVWGAPRVRFGVLVGGNKFRLFTVERDEEFVQRLVYGVDRFWREHVLARVAPDPTAQDVGILSRIRPEPGKTISLPDELRPTIEEFLAACERIKLIKKDRDAAKASLLSVLGDASIGLMPDGRQLCRSLVKEAVVKEYTRKSYYTFTVKQPKGDA